MGIGTKRLPLPAPTELSTDESAIAYHTGHMDDSATDLATNVSHAYTIPEDGRPITVPTDGKVSLFGSGGHGRNKSHTSLMIEYFEGGKTGPHGAGRPSVRVKVTPSSKRKNKSGQSDAVQITGIGKDRKPSYTRRISLGARNDGREGSAPPIEGTELSHSSESNVSGRPPVEVEILNHGSDLSNNTSRVSRDLHYYINPSDVSSMPPDSLLTAGEGASELSERPHSPLIEEEAKAAINEHLQAPSSGHDRNRSISRERITQKVMEKLKQRQEHSRPIEYEPDNKPSKERRRRTSRSHHSTEDNMTNTESSLLSASNISPSQTSYRSGATSKVSLNNPKLLEMVEDTVRRLILPEIDQLKRTDRNRRDFDDVESYNDSRDSYGESRDSYSEDTVGRRLSKSSSSPNISSKPKVVLNRTDDEPGEVLSRGDSERRKTRKSSRESVSSASRSHRSTKEEREETKVHRKKSSDSHRLRTSVAGAAVAGLTAAALNSHNSRDTDSREKRKRRTKSKSHSSRSRSTSIAENDENVLSKEDIPPMPFNSAINESEVTRTSILSDATERPGSRHSEDTRTPVKEVSRYSIGGDGTPSSRTPTQATTRQIGTNHSNQSIADSSPTSPSTPRTISAKARIAALAAAGLGGSEIRRKVDEEKRSGLVEEYDSPRSYGRASPSPSVASLKQKFDDPLIPQGLRPRSRLSLASPTTERPPFHSDLSESSVTHMEHGLAEHLRPVSGATYDEPEPAGTPRGEDMEEWFQKQHEENERYRRSMLDSNISDDTSDRRHTRYTHDNYSSGAESGVERDVRGVANQPRYVDSPHAVESAVASLLEPSMVSSSTGTGVSSKYEKMDHQHRMTENLHEIHQGSSPAPHEIAAATGAEQSDPMKSRWSALREQAQALSNKGSSHGSADPVSPLQSESASLRARHSLHEESPVKLGASGIPLMDDPMPEIGHGLDNVSEVSTNPPEIQGVKGKNHKDRWSYDTNGFLRDSRESLSQHSGRETTALFGAGAAAAGLAAGHALAGDHQSVSPLHVGHRVSVDNGYSRDSTPGVHQAQAVYMDRANLPANSPPVQHGDEGYASAAHARSPGGLTSKGKHGEYTKEQLAEYEAAMGADDDVFVEEKTKHTRHFSANSHALTSPPYDSATGKGIDRIQSEDVVALMDHLTVRDAQRNARDTEILVTLVRSAAEMRQEFDAMKKFIAEQDRMIMQNTDRDADITVQKVLNGPRPMPAGSLPRSPRASYDSEEFATKRKNIFQRALKGLSKGKNNDMGRIEDMLYQLLGDVETLKGGAQAATSRPPLSMRSDSMDSYDDRYRHNAPDSGYEPEGQAGTSSTPNMSGHLSLTPTRDKHFHSGYDGRRNSANRVSTVMEEGSEDAISLDEREARLLNDQFEVNERRLTPTQETYNRRSGSFDDSPKSHRNHTPEQEKQRKHKSNSSSIFAGIPKLSRWSKTTASSDPDYKRKSAQSYQTQASRSGESLGNDGYYGQNYDLKSDERLRSTQSLVREQTQQTQPAQPTRQALSTHSSDSSLSSRTPSPLLPSETSSRISARDHNNSPLMSGALSQTSPLPQLRRENLIHVEGDDIDAASLEDPKYQAHRNSLLLEHPQPRPGPTHRHQTNLENEARTFSGELEVPVSGLGLTDSDLSQRTEGSDFDPATWGSAPALSLPRIKQKVGVKDDSPLIPPAPVKEEKVAAGPSAQQLQREREDQERREREREEEERNSKDKPRHAYDRMYYSSPLGSGHLLEPIPEVRYSLETDSGHRSPEPSARPSVATNAVNGIAGTHGRNGSVGSEAARNSPGRKITGPRPMGSRNASREVDDAVEAAEGGRSGTVRRKPVARGNNTAAATNRMSNPCPIISPVVEHTRGQTVGREQEEEEEEEQESGWGTWKGKKQR